MKKVIYILLVLTGILCSLPSWASTVQVDVIHSRDRYQLKGTYPILLRLKIADSLYIHGAKSDHEGLFLTDLTFQESSGLKVESILFPEPEKKKFEYFSEPVEVFSGNILVRAALVVGENAATEEQVIKGNLCYQACTSNACLHPENVPVTISLFIVTEGAPATALNRELFLSKGGEEDLEKEVKGSGSEAGLLLTLLGFFLGGLALNLTPCIYPLIPITVSYFGGKSQKLKTHILIHGMLYIAGLAFTNSIIGLSAALSGGMLGSALQNPFVLMFVAGVLILLGLSFFGLWEIRIPAGLARVAAKNYGGYFGTFFMGLTLGIVAAPCIGPFILGLLTYVGQKGDPFMGFLCFFILSIGLGLPLLVLAMFSGVINKLPLSGDWMIWVKKLMGWVLIGMAAYMISPLIPYHLGKAGILTAIAAAAGIHLGWLDRTGRAARRFSYLKKALGLALLCGGIIYLLLAGHETGGIRWIPYDQDIISMAVKDKKPLILDFHADWCGPCRAMGKKVFNDPEIVKLSRHFIALRLDLTHRQPSQDEVLKQFRVRGVPTIIFFNREGVEEEKLRVESYVYKSVFLDKMKRLLEKSPPFQK